MLGQLEKVRQQLQNAERKPLGTPFFSDRRYRAFEFSVDRFKPLEGQARFVASVDGGNQELLGGASASLQFVRVYGNVFENRQKVHAEKHEFLALTQAKDGIGFECHIFPLRGGLLQEEGVLCLDRTELFAIEERSAASQIGALTRRFAEWALCEKILSRFDDIVLLKDGTLQTSGRKEAFYAQRALRNASTSRRLVALSKTSTLLTTTGWSVTDAVSSMAPSGVWAYCWVAESDHPDHPAFIGVVKLHSLSQAFRVEAYKGNPILPWERLAQNASDPSFIGYPYALIDADHNARVTDEEASSLRGLVEVAFGRRQSEVHEWLSKL